MALELEMALNSVEFLAWLALLGLLYFNYPGRRLGSYWNILAGFGLIAVVAGLHLAEMLVLQEHAETIEFAAHFLNMGAAVLLFRGLVATHE